MIRFKIFGIPVEIHPFFWVTACLLGGGVEAHSREAIFDLLLFIGAALISILVHEFGHALTGLKYGGGHARIELNGFGGLAYHEGGLLNRDQRFRMVAAGPGAGLGLFVLVMGLLCVPFHDADVWSFVSSTLFGTPFQFRAPELPRFILAHPQLMSFADKMIWINFWWSVLNLLPVLPLDGGKIAELYVHPRRKVYQIGMVVAGAMALFGYFKWHQLYTALLFGFLAWNNYQKSREESWR